MKILFWGGYVNNYGPDNINRSVIDFLTDRFWCVSATGKYRDLLEGLWKLLHSDAVVISGISRKGALLVAAAKLLGKKTVYIVHGCIEAENKLNGFIPSKRRLKHEAFLFRHADLLLPVSKRYKHWLRARYPEYAGKIDYIYNGIDTNLFQRLSSAGREPGTVAAAGGMALLKNNRIVAQAVETLQGKASLKVYDDAGKDTLAEFVYSRRMGKLPHDQFLECLSNTSLFVLNSVQESFSISTMEAFACGCSLLVSEVAGVCDLLALEETDIIHDPLDVEEIRGKIAYLLEHPNNARLRSQFDPEQWSFAKMAENLERKCEVLLRSGTQK